VPKLHESVGQVCHDAFGAAIQSWRYRLIQRRDLSDFQMPPIYRRAGVARIRLFAAKRNFQAADGVLYLPANLSALPSASSFASPVTLHEKRDIGLHLEPASSAVPAATDNNQHDDDDEKCRGVHSYLLGQTRESRPCRTVISIQIIVQRSNDLFKIAHIAECMKPGIIRPSFSRRDLPFALAERPPQSARGRYGRTPRSLALPGAAPRRRSRRSTGPR
jgi:hypothetical protein